MVDDNADAADLLGEMLTQSGHVAKVAYDPAAALDIATSFQPEVAFLDIGLPVMDGYELAAQLRRELAGNGDLPDVCPDRIRAGAPIESAASAPASTGIS